MQTRDREFFFYYLFCTVLFLAEHKKQATLFFMHTLFLKNKIKMGALALAQKWKNTKIFSDVTSSLQIINSMTCKSTGGALLLPDNDACRVTYVIRLCRCARAANFIRGSGLRGSWSDTEECRLFCTFWGLKTALRPLQHVTFWQQPVRGACQRQPFQCKNLW